MATIVTRQTAGGGATVNNAPLTNTQLDNNFINLNTSKLEATSNLSDLNNLATARTNLDVYSKSESSNNFVSTGKSIAMAIVFG